MARQLEEATMTIEEIRKNAPPKTTHYYEVGQSIYYAYVKRGRVYRVPTAIWIDCNEGWLKYFRHELKPLN